MKHTFLIVLVCAAAAMITLGSFDTLAQQSSSGRQGAMFDITGQWVAVVDEDWRWRMVTPPKGDTSSVPLNPSGRRVAASWDLAADRTQGRLCKAFGGPGLIRQPGRIRIRWENDNTLVMEFDAGMQTRRLYFGTPPAPGGRSLQGYSIANWFKQAQNRGIFGRGGGPVSYTHLTLPTSDLV